MMFMSGSMTSVDLYCQPIGTSIAYDCDFCDATFDRAAGLRIHRESRHKYRLDDDNNFLEVDADADKSSEYLHYSTEVTPDKIDLNTGTDTGKPKARRTLKFLPSPKKQRKSLLVAFPVIKTEPSLDNAEVNFQQGTEEGGEACTTKGSLDIQVEETNQLPVLHAGIMKASGTTPDTPNVTVEDWEKDMTMSEMTMMADEISSEQMIDDLCMGNAELCLPITVQPESAGSDLLAQDAEDRHYQSPIVTQIKLESLCDPVQGVDVYMNNEVLSSQETLEYLPEIASVIGVGDEWVSVQKEDNWLEKKKSDKDNPDQSLNTPANTDWLNPKACRSTSCSLWSVLDKLKHRPADVWQPEISHVRTCNKKIKTEPADPPPSNWTPKQILRIEPPEIQCPERSCKESPTENQVIKFKEKAQLLLKNLATKNDGEYERQLKSHPDDGLPSGSRNTTNKFQNPFVKLVDCLAPNTLLKKLDTQPNKCHDENNNLQKDEGIGCKPDAVDWLHAVDACGLDNPQLITGSAVGNIQPRKTGNDITDSNNHSARAAWTHGNESGKDDMYHSNFLSCLDAVRILQQFLNNPQPHVELLCTISVRKPSPQSAGGANAM